ncbi:hypothetical protein KGQ19_12655 [Catenulispora sp. NL8]|uniref:Uncharacterized protein n=1 Tax=Catenulispora pinistramenti TaxID=2705254 RepID=A0ABS5KNT9_9ACTN|nr:hypothetical protein [Catenulispora pinistramenti]MBS2547718.1 hypothetical protein [Catenulispora pinistramenti]
MQYRFKGVPVPSTLVPFAIYLEVLELRIRKTVGEDRGEGAVSAAIVIVAIVAIAGAIVFALNGLKDKTVSKVNSTNP